MLNNNWQKSLQGRAVNNQLALQLRYDPIATSWMGTVCD